MRSKSLFALFAVAVVAALWGPARITHAGDDHAQDVTRIHLTEKNGYFEAEETLMNLEPGAYVFEVTNEAGKMVGFLIQDLKTEERLAMGPIEPGETREYEVQISENGFRYRCPINPTPWYEVAVGKM